MDSVGSQTLLAVLIIFDDVGEAAGRLLILWGLDEQRVSVLQRQHNS